MRRKELDALLPTFRELWHAQPFREPRPNWALNHPALTEDLLRLDEAEVEYLADDTGAALKFIARHLPDVACLAGLEALPIKTAARLAIPGERWAWEIPGRKRSQIEAFAGVAQTGDAPILDWCGGKGHLGRLLALVRDVPVRTLEIDPALCGAGQALAKRLSLCQDFSIADALQVEVPAGCHAVALHACGDLHRRLIEQGAKNGVARFDVAPCCYYRGVTGLYQPLVPDGQTLLSRDDTRLAVTETVTASPRLRRRRDREMAWKLGFDAYRRASGEYGYKSFKPISAAWFGGQFPEFLQRVATREGLPVPGRSVREWEEVGWQRLHEVLRLSIVRQAFRRLIELWLVLDLSVYLEMQGYSVDLGIFCERSLTPRNLLISARRA
ncbi:MAG: methyltransferase [Rhodocyclales bacterium GT-UBC]|nr:MAG: methyltransferase [Rhodocyclales bacterium GT-UBC]